MNKTRLTCLPSHIVAIMITCAAATTSRANDTLIAQTDGTQVGGSYGNAVASLDDVNHDGFPDYIIGEPGYDANGATVGSSHGRVIVRSGFDDSSIRTILGTNADDAFGTAVAAVGDLTNDGIADFAVGSPGWDQVSPFAWSNVGRVDVFDGESGSLLGGFAPAEFSVQMVGQFLSGAGDVGNLGRPSILVGGRQSPVVYAIDVDTSVDPVVITLIQTFTMAGSGTGPQYFFGAASIGYIDTDSYVDVVAGEVTYDLAGPVLNAGRIVAFSGVDGSVIYTREGTTAFEALGSSLTAVGDVDTDGKTDFVAGGPGYNPGGLADTGIALVCSGSDGSVIHSLVGAAAGDFMGSSVSAAGNVNIDADSIVDFVVGSPGRDTGGTDAGMAVVYSGADGTTVLNTYYGSVAGMRIGRAVSGGLDLNQEGYPDIILGAPESDISGVDAGSVRVYSPNGYICQDDAGYQGPGTVALTVCGGDLSVEGRKAVLEVSGGPASAAALMGIGFSLNPVSFHGGTSAANALFVNVGLNAAGGLKTVMEGGTNTPIHVFLQVITGEGSPVTYYLSNTVDVFIAP